MEVYTSAKNVSNVSKEVKKIFKKAPTVCKLLIKLKKGCAINKTICFVVAESKHQLRATFSA